MTSPPALHPLFERLFAKHRFANIAGAEFDRFRPRAGHTLLFFSEDPGRFRETLDLAVILPELDRAFAGQFTVGVLLPEAARQIAPRYGFRRWPALVVLRDGAYVGAIDGLRNWDDYLGELATLLAAEPTRPPAIGIAVTTAGQSVGGCQ